jgi:hypothetical protein
MNSLCVRAGPLLLALCGLLAAPTGCSGRGSRSDDAAGDLLAAAAELDKLPPVGRADVPAAAAPACRIGRPIEPVSPREASARSPSLAWGPGVVGLAYVRDEGLRAMLALERMVDGVRHGPTVEVGEGAAREPTGLAWDGTSFVFAWGEPQELVPEVFVGMVDAAGNVKWDASRLTETLRTGAWRTAGRTAVESKDPRVLALGDLLLLSWRTRTYPEAHPLYFAAVQGLEVSAPVPVSAETDFVLDHQLVAWGDGAGLAYIGRFEKTQRQVRLARLAQAPPAVRDDWLIADLSAAPDWFELAAVSVGPEVVLLWRGKTEWNSTSNVAYARVGPDGPGGPMADTTVVEGALASNPPVNMPRRSFAVAPSGGGFVLAWSYQDKPKDGGATGLRLAVYHADGTLNGAPLSLPVEEHIARDPALLAGPNGEYWFAFVVGDPPNERGRLYLGSAICTR